MDLHLTLGVRAQHRSPEDTTLQADAVASDVTDTQSTRPISLSAHRLDALLQMQRTDSFCKCISK